MLKYRTPFYPAHDYQLIRDFTQGGSRYADYEYVRDDLQYVKDNYQIDLVANYLDHRFKYFKNDFIYTQPWAPNSSSECRLFVSLESIDKPYIDYDPVEHENKMHFFSYMRNYKYYPVFYEKLREHRDNDYDGCLDCTREIQIIANYLMGYHGYGNHAPHRESAVTSDTSDSSASSTVSDTLDSRVVSAQNDQQNIQQIHTNLSDQRFVNGIFEIYQLINSYTFFDLTDSNFKCKQHGGLHCQSRYTSVYVKDRDQLVWYRIDRNGKVSRQTIPVDNGNVQRTFEAHFRASQASQDSRASQASQASQDGAKN
jgi:hypothetical protein